MSKDNTLGLILFSVLGAILFAALEVYLGPSKENTREVPLGGLHIPHERSTLPIIKERHFYYDKKSNYCFELLNDTTLQLRCVCTCDKFNNK